MDRIYNKFAMECDVIPTSPQEVDPLGNVEHCNGLDEEGVLYAQPLNATLITSGADDVSVVPKSRKILNMPTTKSRKLLTIRSSTSPPISHPISITELNVSIDICL